MKRNIGTDSDEVVAYCPIPTGGKLIRSGIELGLMANGAVDVGYQFQWSVSGKVVSVLDPETQTNLDDLWDMKVSKASSRNASDGGVTLDYDTDTADINPQTQFTQPNWDEMMGTDLEKFEFLSHTAIVSFPKNPVGFVGGTPATYIPTDFYRKVSKSQKRVDTPSYALVAVSSPDTASAHGGLPFTLSSAQEWTSLQYLEDTAVDAYKQLMGATQAGAKDMYLDAATLIEGLVPVLMHDDRGWSECEWHASCSAFFDVEVPGELRVRSIGAE